MTDVSGPTFETPLSPSPEPNGDPPVPTSGTYSLSLNRAVVFFDKPLYAESHSTAVFACKVNGKWRVPTSAFTTGYMLVVNCFTGGPVDGGPWITYIGNTIRGIDDKYVLPFAEFPLVVS